MKNFLFFGRELSFGGRAAVLLFVRLLVGAMMLTHGLAKLMAFSAVSAQFPDILGLGGPMTVSLVILAEVGCAFLLMLGLFTRPAAAVLTFNMFIATFVAHAADPFAAKEMAVFYLGIFVALFFWGAGKYSLDYLFFGKRWGCGCGCNCGCGDACTCGPDCSCGCQEGKECTCGPDCTCGCHEGKECTCGDNCTCGCHTHEKCSCGQGRCGMCAPCRIGSIVAGMALYTLYFGGCLHGLLAWILLIVGALLLLLGLSGFRICRCKEK